MRYLYAILMAAALGVTVACNGALTVEEYAAACGEYTGQLASSQGTARAHGDWSTSMEELIPPQELDTLHHLMISPGWSTVETEREIITAFEDVVGVKVYSENIPFGEMIAALEAQAQRQWGDDAGAMLQERLDLDAILQSTLDSQQKMKEDATEILRTLEDLSAETSSLLVAEGCIPEAVENALQR